MQKQLWKIMRIKKKKTQVNKSSANLIHIYLISNNNFLSTKNIKVEKWLTSEFENVRSKTLQLHYRLNTIFFFYNKDNLMTPVQSDNNAEGSPAWSIESRNLMYCFQKANGLLININNYEKTFEWHFINTLPRGRIRHTFKLDIHFLSPRSVRVAIVWLGLVKHYPISRQDLEKKRG